MWLYVKESQGLRRQLVLKPKQGDLLSFTCHLVYVIRRKLPESLPSVLVSYLRLFMLSLCGPGLSGVLHWCHLYLLSLAWIWVPLPVPYWTWLPAISLRREHLGVLSDKWPLDTLMCLCVSLLLFPFSQKSFHSEIHKAVNPIDGRPGWGKAIQISGHQMGLGTASVKIFSSCWETRNIWGWIRLAYRSSINCLNYEI